MFRFNSSAVIKNLRRNASTLVVGEHDGAKLTQGTLACITAATKIGGGNVHLLIAGNDVTNLANDATKISGVNKVLSLSNPVSIFLFLFF